MGLCAAVVCSIMDWLHVWNVKCIKELQYPSTLQYTIAQCYHQCQCQYQHSTVQ